MPAAGASIDLIGQELLSVPTVINRTGAEVITTGNYTIAEGVSTSTGVKTIILTTKAGSVYASKDVNISYTYGPDGYVDDTGNNIKSIKYAIHKNSGKVDL